MKQFLTKLSSSWLLKNTQNCGVWWVNLFIQDHESYSNWCRVHCGPNLSFLSRLMFPFPRVLFSISSSKDPNWFLFLKSTVIFCSWSRVGGWKFLATVVWPPVQASKNNQAIHTGPIYLLLAFLLCPYCAKRVSVPSFQYYRKRLSLTFTLVGISTFITGGTVVWWLSTGTL